MSRFMGGEEERGAGGGADADGHAQRPCDDAAAGSNRRGWARRAALSLLTGGGLTIASIAGSPAAHAAGSSRRTGSPPRRTQTTTSTSVAATTATSSSTSSSSTSSASTVTGSSTSTGSSSTSSTGATSSTSAAETTTTTTEAGSGTATPPRSSTTTTETGSSTSTQRSGAGSTGSGSTSTTTSSSSSTSRGGPGSGQGGRRGRKRRQSGGSGSGSRRGRSGGGGGTGGTGGTRDLGRSRPGGASSHNAIAPPPRLAASQSETLSSMLGTPAASLQALDYYRIPLFLLPIYQAAAVQYGVPWQVLAAINEVETDYGNDLNVSSAGAVGWMQFMPETWLQYGVDVQEAGYADPYNPVDAIFAAARYLRAAGVSKSLTGAIFAYNHSQAYVESVMLRAKLIAHYPPDVIATLTGLAEGRLPIAGALATGEETVPLAGGGSAGAGTSRGGGGQGASSGAGSGSGRAGAASSAGSASEPLPGSRPAPSPLAGAASSLWRQRGRQGLPIARSERFVDLVARAKAPVVAVQDGKIIAIGRSRRLGRYIVLRDIFGNVFTYAGLGQIARTYTTPTPKTAPGQQISGAVLAGAAASEDAAPTQAASAGSQSPQTLKVESPGTPAARQGGGAAAGQGGAAVGGQQPGLSAAQQQQQEQQQQQQPPPGKVRMFAHPENPYARAALARAAEAAGAHRLRVGSVVSQGTILGSPQIQPGSAHGSIRFAIAPAEDPSTVAAQPILQSWRQLYAALHPQGAKRETGLLGATAGDAFLLSRAALQSTLLSDPGISLGRCARHDVAIGAFASRPLATLVFLSRSGLKPTVAALPCLRQVGHRFSAPGTGVRGALQAIEISKVNGIPIAGHQGAGSIADLTVRTLLTLQGGSAPSRIVSLMRYPGSPNTIASPRLAGAIEISYVGSSSSAAAEGGAAGAAGAAGEKGSAARASTFAGIHAPGAAAIGAGHWGALIVRIGALPQPQVSRKRSSAAVTDPGSAGGAAGSGGAEGGSGAGAGSAGSSGSGAPGGAGVGAGLGPGAGTGGH